MKKTEILIIIILVLALGCSLTALIFSMESRSNVQKIEKSLGETNSSITEMKEVVDEIKPMMSDLKVVSDLVPRLEHFFIGSPIPSEVE